MEYKKIRRRIKESKFSKVIDADIRE